MAVDILSTLKRTSIAGRECRSSLTRPRSFLGRKSWIRRQFCLSEPNLLSHLLKKKMSTSMTQWFVLILVSEAVPSLSSLVTKCGDFGSKMSEYLTQGAELKCRKLSVNLKAGRWWWVVFRFWKLKYSVQHQLCRIDNFTGFSNLVVYFIWLESSFVGM